MERHGPIQLVGLVEMELPIGTVRLSDGGAVEWADRGTFLPSHPILGPVIGLDPVADAFGDEAPSARLTFAPPEVAAMVSLLDRQAQSGSVRLWLAQLDAAMRSPVTPPELLFRGFVDGVTGRAAQGSRTVDIEIVTAADRLFAVKEGNVLSSRFHQTAWPGELGFDYCTGAAVAVPWGVVSPRGQVVAGGGAASRFAAKWDLEPVT